MCIYIHTLRLPMLHPWHLRTMVWDSSETTLSPPSYTCRTVFLWVCQIRLTLSARKSDPIESLPGPFLDRLTTSSSAQHWKALLVLYPPSWLFCTRCYLVFLKYSHKQRVFFVKIVDLPNVLLALFAEIVPVLNATKAEFKLSSVHDLVGPSFFGVSIPNLWALCHKVVEGMP